MAESRTVEALLKQSARRIAGLTEWPQRTNAFAGYVAEIAPEDASAFFDALVVRAAAARGGGARVTSFTARFAAARGEWPAEHIARTREAAVGQGDRLTDALLFPPEAEEYDEALPIPDYGAQRPLSLGERRALAVQPSRRVVELAMRDPDPRVASRLLGNPKLTENDVVRTAARRLMPSATLLEIALSARWRERPRVAVALAQNPKTPVWAALSLLPDLGARAIAETADDGNLDPRLRGAAALLLEAVGEFRQLSR
jgi:hypothetical protein